MRDTSEIHDEIHVSQIHPDRYVSDMKETCGIHARYMRDTCILRGNQDTCGIHAGYLPDVFGPGKYGTSGVNSRGGKQNYKDEWCAWKRFARDGRNFRVLEHTTGYFYQEGFLPSQTEAGEEEDEKEEADE